MSRTVTNKSLAVVCDDPLEVWRAETAFTKEPGTIAWLDQLREGDVFYDVGANIGIYTLYAAQKVGKTGTVLAFEPHLPNADHLIRNVQAAGNIFVLSIALGKREEFLPFNSTSLRPGSSGHQVGHMFDERGNLFIPAAKEFKFVTTLDQLIERHGFANPSAVKIDVDGNELDVLTGMEYTLMHGNIRVQVEVHPKHREDISAFMRYLGYRIDCIHFTANGQKAIDRGANSDDIVNNTVFVKT